MELLLIIGAILLFTMFTGIGGATISDRAERIEKQQPVAATGLGCLGAVFLPLVTLIVLVIFMAATGMTLADLSH